MAGDPESGASMGELLAALRAVAETTRLRLLVLCARGELTVSELAQILGQSQPRVSRHLKLLCEAGLLDRFREGSWVFYRLSSGGAAPIVDIGIGKAKAAMGMIFTQEFERVRGEIDDDEDAVRAQHPRRFEDRRGRPVGIM